MEKNRGVSIRKKKGIGTWVKVEKIHKKTKAKRRPDHRLAKKQMDHSGSTRLRMTSLELEIPKFIGEGGRNLERASKKIKLELGVERDATCEIFGRKKESRAKRVRAKEVKKSPQGKMKRGEGPSEPNLGKVWGRHGETLRSSC